LLLRLFNEDLSKITTFARVGGGSDLDLDLATFYPPAVMRAWNFDIVDEHQNHPIEYKNPPAQLGLRSSLRFPIRIDDRLIGGLGVMSYEPAKYTSGDVMVGRRLADHLAVGLSHQRLAEEDRRAVALRERAANLEMLDGLLTTLTGVLDIREV